METIEQLDTKLAEPSEDLVADVAELRGDIIILGVAGKMGPSLAQLARNAIDLAGVDKNVIGVARFSSGNSEQELGSNGIETIATDLLDERQLQSLPEVENVIYMAGTKFGTTGREHLTWAVNSYLPGRVAEKFKESQVVVFSTGNVYPLTSVMHGGPSEDHPTGPVGEYAQSCLGRERVFEHFSRKYSTPMLLFRLNYAIDLRYGILLEVATAIKEQRPIDLSMGYVNVIWQGDANEAALRSLTLCDSPPRILNVTGPEMVSVRWLAQKFGELLGIEPVFVNEEQDTALLSNAARAHGLFGYPKVPLQQMIEWTANWVEMGGPVLDKPTHFQEREGEF
ncbi:MAG: NAD(P)-dependent oxidoreductase [Actinomycetota bacterium]|nr:NAD(P)-dependent oxidoreductase [Actinomycetota bacterium]